MRNSTAFRTIVLTLSTSVAGCVTSNMTLTPDGRSFLLYLYYLKANICFSGLMSGNLTDTANGVAGDEKTCTLSSAAATP